MVQSLNERLLTNCCDSFRQRTLNECNMYVGRPIRLHSRLFDYLASTYLGFFRLHSRLVGKFWADDRLLSRTVSSPDSFLVFHTSKINEIHRSFHDSNDEVYFIITPTNLQKLLFQDNNNAQKKRVHCMVWEMISPRGEMPIFIDIHRERNSKSASSGRMSEPSQTFCKIS